MLKAACATCDFFIENTPTDGVCYWDTGAPNLHRLDHYLDRPADPFNDHEPVDSTASAIGLQGLLRLGQYLMAMPSRTIDWGNGRQATAQELGQKYWQAGLTVLNILLEEPYLSTDAAHQGLLLHSIYHHPNGWDYVPAGSRIPYGESSMWGDYHIREAALYVQRIIEQQPYYAFYGCVKE
jgi:unsaturated chondroitin disaccharide hydrolase